MDEDIISTLDCSNIFHDNNLSNNNDVQRLHRIVNTLLGLLENVIADEPPFSEVEHIFGPKENVISVITKLSQILFKITPLLENNDHAFDKEIISEEEQKIVEEFIERYNKTRSM